MDNKIAFISSDGKGKVKLEYMKNGSNRILSWSVKGSKALETVYDENGAILLQRLVMLDRDGVDKKIKEILKATGLGTAQKTEFISVTLKKPCPKCKEYALTAHSEAFQSSNEVPIMPIYNCTSCKARSYYLTDQYLEYLVENNKELFTKNDISVLSSSKDAFLSEVKEHIISIFASQKVMCIR